MASVRGTRLWVPLGALVLLGAVWPSATPAATLKADYQFQETRSSSVAGAPALTDLGPGMTYATETVGSCSTRVLTFPKGSGLEVNLNNMGFTSGPQISHFSVVMTVRLDEVGGDISFKKLLDYKLGTQDQGLYVHDGALDWFVDDANHEGSPAIAPGTYVEIAFTTNVVSASNTRGIGYLNGVSQFFHTSSQGIIGIADNRLRFFKDDTGDGGRDEDPAGGVSRIRVYDGR